MTALLPTLPEFKFQVSWTTNSYDAPTYVDLTADLISFITHRGRQHDLNRMEAGTASVVLDNLSGDYWPNNAASPYYGHLDIHKKAQILATWNGTTYELFTGYIESFTPDWSSEPKGPVMRLDLMDAQAFFSRNLVNNAGYSQELSGDRIGHILDDIDFPAADRTIDAGIYEMQATGALENINAQDLISQVYDSEIGLFYIDAAGNAVFEDRSHRTSATSSAIFTDSMAGIGLSLDDILLANQVRATIEGGVEQVSDDAASQALYGVYVLVKTGLLLTLDGYALEFAALMIARYAYTALRAKSMTLKPQSDPDVLYPSVLGFDISTRITVELTEASIDADYFIEAIDHNFDARTGEFTTAWMLSDAARYLHNAAVINLILRPNTYGDSAQAEPFLASVHPQPPNWDRVNGLTKVTSEFVGTHDPHTTYLDLYNLPNLGSTGGVINKVTVSGEFWANGAGYDYHFKTALKTGGTVYYGADHTGTGTESGLYSDEFAVNPDTGVAWTLADVAALQAGLEMTEVYAGSPDTPQVRCYQLYVTVNVTPQW